MKNNIRNVPKENISEKRGNIEYFENVQSCENFSPCKKKIVENGNECGNENRIKDESENNEIEKKEGENNKIQNNNRVNIDSVKNESENNDRVNNDNKIENDANEIIEFGQSMLDKNELDYKIQLISIIGEIEGHECLPSNSKTTKYEHILPKLAEIEEDKEIDGVLLILNTVGGDVESGLAIAEMIASLSKPTVSLVLGGSHSIGVPLAVATDHSMIVPTGTMVIHPVRMSGTVIGAQATYDYFQQMQDRIIGFVTSHCNVEGNRMEELMMNTQMLTKDLGTILVGKQAVDEGIIDSLGGISDAFKKLYSLISEKKSKN